MAGLGGQKTGGRQAGTPNKVTRQLRDMIITALDRAGGEEYLVQQAHDNPKAFLSLLGRIIPTQVTGPGDKELFPVQEMTIAELEARILALLMRAGIAEEQARAVIDVA